jgi:large subunit ribosomal protein L31
MVRAGHGPREAPEGFCAAETGTSEEEGTAMKEGIHPKYRPVKVTCAGCGTVHETRSTKAKDFSIDVCSHCHPFYTGRQKFVDSAGRVERFQKKWGGRKPAAAATAAAKEEPAAEAEKK